MISHNFFLVRSNIEFGFQYMSFAWNRFTEEIIHRYLSLGVKNTRVTKHVQLYYRVIDNKY